jgi:hypothetical protein
MIAALSAAACIFDNGKDYEGGGRRDTASLAPSATTTATATTTSTKPGKVADAAPDLDTGALPLPDAADQ